MKVSSEDANNGYNPLYDNTYKLASKKLKAKANKTRKYWLRRSTPTNSIDEDSHLKYKGIDWAVGKKVHQHDD